jgi:hypothetical protein
VADEPVKLPRNLCAAADVVLNVMTGVVVALLTELVSSGSLSVVLTEVTVPALPVPTAVHALPL